MNTWDKAQALKVLRTGAAAIEDDEQVTLVQSIAGYIDSTANHRGVSNPREVLAEIAMAYVEGYEHATGERAREAWVALRAAGLTL